MSQNEQKDRGVVRILTDLLDQAKLGQITSLMWVQFKLDGTVDFGSQFSEKSDLDRAPEHITNLKKLVLNLAQTGSPFSPVGMSITEVPRASKSAVG